MVAAGAQLAAADVFLWLFRRTEYTGAEQLAGGENVLFRLDPLVGAAAMLAARQVVALFWPALVLVGLTLFWAGSFAVGFARWERCSTTFTACSAPSPGGPMRFCGRDWPRRPRRRFGPCDISC